MTARDWDEVLWGFSWNRGQLERGSIGIFSAADDDELLERRGQAPRRVDEVFLPRPFMDTALLEAGSWQRRPLAQAHAERLGVQMWQTLPEPLRAPLVAPRTAPRALRLRIASTGAGVDEIPWEWITAQGRPPLALEPDAHVLRSVPVPFPEPALTVTPPLRVLLVTTNPKDDRLLDAGAELSAIAGGLGAPHFEVRTLDGATREALVGALAAEPHIVHYVGHAALGQGQGYLVLHDFDGRASWLSAAELARMLPPSVRLLCLSTCFSASNYNVGGLTRLGHAPAELHLPTMLVNQYAITEAGARAFWGAFYPALVQAGGDAVPALHQARAAAAAASPSTCDWASFSLVVRDRVGRPFRLAATGTRDPARFAAELQAQFSARLASELALRVNELGADVSDSLKAGAEQAFTQLDALRKRIE